MDHVMFENEAGEAECVACGRRIHFRDPFKITATGDNTVRHTFSTVPGLTLNTSIEQE